MRKTLLATIPLIAALAHAERQPYERYATIVDRQMFGELPLGFDPTKMPNEVAKTSAREEKELSQEQEQVKKAIRFSVINVTPAGETVVGFSDNGDPKNPRHYYLKVGESQNGWTVKDADAQTATMTVEKDGVEVTLKLGGDSGGGASTKAAEPRAPRAGSGLLANRMSFRERKRLEQQQQQADAAKLAEEARAREAREAEEKQQREAERAEQREQLLRIQEELRKAREARESQKEAEDSQPEA